MKYKFYCLSCNAWKEREWLVVEPVCQTNLNHIVIPESISIIHSIERCGEDNTQLYRTLRRQLIQYVIEHGEEMTPDALKQASEHFATPQQIRNLFFSQEEQVALGELFNKRAVADRTIRNNKVVSELMNHLTYSQTIEVVNDLEHMSANYVNYGVEGTSEGDPIGIFDYFESTAGTLYENNGFLQKQFQPAFGLTIGQLSQRVMNILRITI